MKPLACLLMIAAAAFAQDEPPPEDAGVVIRSTTSLVQVRVLARDAGGNPVADLRRAEFHILDDKKPQPVTAFNVERSDARTVTSAPPGDTAGPADKWNPADGYSLIVLDWLNTNYADRYRSREDLLRLLKTFQPRQRVAVYMLGKRPRLIWDFTSDMQELAQAIEEAGLEPEDMGPEAQPGRFDARYGRPATRATVEEQVFFWNVRITDTFRAFEEIAARLARVPGRKSLIWLSAAFPLVINSSVIRGASALEVVYQQNLERLLARLNRADVAVYPVDACGLATNQCAFHAPMIQLAERTGGVAFLDRNDIDTGIRMAFEDTRVTYTIGFNLPADAAPGVHELKVKVDRPRVALRYRESYQVGR